jgi:hypothetical protein
MIDAQVTSQGLKVVLTGKDAWLFATRPRWEIVVPLEHVRQAEVGSPVGLAVKRHSGGNGGHGTNMTAARRTGPTAVIDLDGDPYVRMTLSVPDPEDTVAAIKAALRLRNR